LSFTFDANVLLYASDETSEYHPHARAFLDQVASSDDLIYLFWPTVMAYLRIATHPAIFEKPLRPADAVANIEQLIALTHVQTVGEHERFWTSYRRVAGEADARGNVVPDAHVVALMVENGVRTIWTHDRDYRRFHGIESRDPFD
jgi:toxin-antitoxin system PIN domain toxin